MGIPAPAAPRAPSRAIFWALPQPSDGLKGDGLSG